MFSYKLIYGNRCDQAQTHTATHKHMHVKDTETAYKSLEAQSELSFPLSCITTERHTHIQRTDGYKTFVLPRGPTGVHNYL